MLLKRLENKSLTTSHHKKSLQSKVQVKNTHTHTKKNKTKTKQQKQTNEERGESILSHKNRKIFFSKFSVQGNESCLLCQQTQNTSSDIN